jgi:alkanesulfonate monooxygenase SsuD/methylene tetrahydromethanopterin reductase-like flavin-dependent oxidoreductase (luciferase family)
MKFTLSVAMSPLDQLADLAIAAQECGFTSIALPDSLFYSETVSADYPYTPDGSRFWTEETPWADPLVAATHMAALTRTLRFYTSVLKLGSRNPVLLARQVGSVAALTKAASGWAWASGGRRRSSNGAGSRTPIAASAWTRPSTSSS